MTVRGRYELLRSIASGGMATVHLGRALGVGGFERFVAIKVMHAHLAEEPEFDVPPDPRTPQMTENPAHTLEISESASAPADDELAVELHGRYYSVRQETGYQWNKKCFSLLYQLFQLSVTAPEQTGPEITIAK